MGGTGIVRDNLFIEHDPGAWHPEKPERLRAIYRALDGRKWPGLVTLPPREATREEITLLHDARHFDRIADTDGQSVVHIDADTATSPKSFKAALFAAGGLIGLTEKVIKGKLSNGFALVRPPGHHAEVGEAMGFCLFNNVAVAAAYAVKKMGLQRVMIVDWDLHHGNGTQHAFYDDPSVLYVSTHQYPYYPGSGALSEVGSGSGRGYTINVPLGPRHGDSQYVSIFQKIVLPAAREYKPELILVSAGFDIYMQDPLGAMNVTPAGFAAMTRLLMDVANEVAGGRLAFTLEGGYHIDGQTMGVEKVLETLTGTDHSGEDLAHTEQPEPPIIAQVRQAQAGLWNL